MRSNFFRENEEFKNTTNLFCSFFLSAVEEGEGRMKRRERERERERENEREEEEEEREISEIIY